MDRRGTVNQKNVSVGIFFAFADGGHEDAGYRRRAPGRVVPPERLRIVLERP